MNSRSDVHSRIEIWEKLLLDFGKRNRLLNFHEFKRSDIKIITPSYEKIYERIVVNEKEIKFPYAKEYYINNEGKEICSEMFKGDVDTSKQSVFELQKTLKTLRYRAISSMEEQGINTLYLTFGMLKWKDIDYSNEFQLSPLILVPVRLTISSLTSPFVLSLADEEIVINPTLTQKLNNLGIEIDVFDSAKDDICTYLSCIKDLVKNKNWEVENDVHLTLLSFLKINMYRDIKENEEKLIGNNFISALCGNGGQFTIPQEYIDFDHDNKIKPIDSFQVLDADSSQQDAILLSKKGYSFVLQGPPGTGKSQTITNIIAEAIANGKKVLFVSEKMAALQVVYKRLKNVGLSNFCLSLHSYKANKRDILQDISNSISQSKVVVSSSAITDLQMLERKRELLNEYQKELHTKYSKLNLSLFEVYGKLAGYSNNVPDVIFNVDNILQLSTQDLEDRVFVLDELSKTIGKKSEDYSTNIWHNSKIDCLTFQLRLDISSNISQVLPMLQSLSSLLKECHNTLGLHSTLSIEDAKYLITILEFIRNCPGFPTNWVYNADLSKRIKKAYDREYQTKEVFELTKKVSGKYFQNIFKQDGKALSTKLQIYNDFNKYIRNGVDKEIYISEVKLHLLPLIKENFEKLKSASEKAKNISILLDLRLNNKIKDITSLYKITTIIRADFYPTDEWLIKDNLPKVKLILDQFEDNVKKRNNLCSKILSTCDDNIFKIDYYPILQRFRDYYNESVFRRIGKEYRNDIKQVKENYISKSRLRFKNTYLLLNDINTLHKIDADINNSKELHIKYFGKRYDSVNTQFDKIRHEIALYEQLLDVCKEFSVTQKFNEIITCRPISVLTELEDYNGTFSNLDINRIILSINNILSFNFTSETDYNTFFLQVGGFIQNTESFIDTCDQINSCRLVAGNHIELLTEIKQLERLQTLSYDFESNKDQLSLEFNPYFNAMSTDWTKLIEVLKYASELKCFIEEHQLPYEFVSKACTNHDFVSNCCVLYENLTSIKNQIEQPLKWILNLFFDNSELNKTNVDDLINRLIKCKDRMDLLEEWVDYQSNIKKCISFNLGEFVNKISEIHIDPVNIVPAYLKRVFSIWIDAALEHFTEVRSFRRNIHDQNIEEFKELDIEQFKIAQARIRERVVRGIPDFDAITSSYDQTGILKRELNKRSRLMPLRKLLHETKDVIKVIKPCFMMSPLSVSIFIDTKDYDFDMVIFDEASQVHTEDAIGAIIRGKQIIIAGDTKQLPPTNFFVNSLNNEDFDTDDSSHDDYIGAFQSILEEAQTILPERSLKWHYRSKNEGLIAFSNIKIYNTSLITFPSTIEMEKGCGVEYVYVKNGTYDRSGKRNNVVEAKRVAELVFESFEKDPNRSIGIVTFSEAQYQTVETAIRQMRLSNRNYESLFSEDRDEPFFIKNLENVQGDERDTIIFSIGYAKDGNNIMHMNFGPLNKDGGERRLNVAITRAKYNIKLVGSIVPEDIDIESTTSEGVKLLRSYIDYAIRGIDAIKNEITEDAMASCESPFEESVYNFLSSKNYIVVRQVGCSGFRIDMAIKDPSNNSKYVLGIECDGATYHCSRTARERDRLRQDVLENIGWTIYRIWSTDWIKNRNFEEQRLLNAVNRSIASSMTLFSTQADVKRNNFFKKNIEIEISDSPNNNSENAYGFLPYTNGQVDTCYTKEDVSNNLIKYIRSTQPVHIDEICKAFKGVFGNKKVTSKIKNNIQYYLKNDLVNQVSIVCDFVTTKNFDYKKDLKVRIKNSNTSYIRTIEHICDDEIKKAMVVIKESSFGIKREGLFLTIAKIFGYKRLNDSLFEYLNHIYSRLVENGTITGD